jgi:uncharacterized membrane protein YjjB (DUF3815 family)
VACPGAVGRGTLNIDLHFLHHTICGGLAAAGFGVLFNIGLRRLPWCAASGALALALRTLALNAGWSMEAASFVAALVLGGTVQLLPSSVAVSRNALHVVGCIPMIPGGFAAKAILGLFAISAQHTGVANETIITAIESTLRVTLIMGALATGVAIPTLLLRVRIAK